MSRRSKLKPELLFYCFDPVEELSEPVHPRDLSFGFGQRHRRIAKPSTAGNVFRNPALRCENRSVADRYVTHYTNLTGYCYMFSYSSTSRDPCLRSNDRMPADHNVVRDLNEIVDLDPLLNPSSSEPGAIDGRVRADFDIVIDLDNPELRDFLVPVLDGFEPETVRSDHGAAVDDYTRADSRSLTNRRIRINYARSSNNTFVTDVRPSADNCLIADAYARLNDCVRLN